jgi:hemolysin-activating ACP:hemolysin acyltransferase
VRFLVDENTGVVVARWLRSQNHEVVSVQVAVMRGLIPALKRERL